MLPAVVLMRGLNMSSSACALERLLPTDVLKACAADNGRKCSGDLSGTPNGVAYLYCSVRVYLHAGS